MVFPPILQGGMGIAVSGWRLASAVARAGHIGTVSGAGLGVVLARRLQMGDADGSYRRALRHLPSPAIAQRILRRYFIDGGKEASTRFVPTPLPSPASNGFIDELTMAACFAEVWLAKENHRGLVSINLLSKVQVQTLSSLYGAMLAGVDIVSMGAGIPLEIPGALDLLASGSDVKLSLDVLDGDQVARRTMNFSPAAILNGRLGHAQANVRRPLFLPIISSATLATVLLRRATGRIDGFVVESSIAGGHNAPPRGQRANDGKQMIWGERDKVDLAAIAKTGLPFYLAGGRASPQAIAEARATGAVGVQVGSAFAFCRESGLSEHVKHSVYDLLRQSDCAVVSDPLASPTGFPFKVLQMEGTLSDTDIYQRRQRTCDWGFLREAYATGDGGVGWRCAAEPVDHYLRKGGNLKATVGRKCLCAGLAAAVGLASLTADGEEEPMIVTSGQDTQCIVDVLGAKDSYGAADVIAHVLAPAGRSAT